MPMWVACNSLLCWSFFFCIKNRNKKWSRHWNYKTHNNTSTIITHTHSYLHSFKLYRPIFLKSPPVVAASSTTSLHWSPIYTVYVLLPFIHSNLCIPSKPCHAIHTHCVCLPFHPPLWKAIALFCKIHTNHEHNAMISNIIIIAIAMANDHCMYTIFTRFSISM